MFASFASSQIFMVPLASKQAQNKQHLLADVQNVLAKHEMFKKFGGGETSMQGHAVEIISCQASSVGQLRQAFTITD